MCNCNSPAKAGHYVHAHYARAGGKLVAYWANPESMGDDTGWDDTKSVCYKDLKVQKLDQTKKMPVIDPNDCKLIELSKPKP